MLASRFWSGMAAVCLLMVSVASADYYITPIPLLTDATAGSGYAISDDGSTVTGSNTLPSNTTACYWTYATGTVDIGTLPSTSYIMAYGQGLSADGSLIVGASTSNSSTSNNTEAFYWNAEDGMVAMGDLAGGNYASSAYKTSADGSVIVGYGTIDSSGTQEGFRWTQATGMLGLGSLAGGTDMSIARGVSSDGSVIAGVASATDDIHAFRWTEAGGMVSLGGLATQTTQQSNGYGVSGDGATVVGWAKHDAALTWEAMSWNETDGMVGLGFLAGGNNVSIAYDANIDGSIIVGAANTGGGVGLATDTAFIWTEAGGMQSLEDFLIGQGVDLTGWDALSGVSDITPDGNYIVGTGVYDPDGDGGVDPITMPFVVSTVPIPEPATFGLLAISALSLIRKRRK